MVKRCIHIAESMGPIPIPPTHLKRLRLGGAVFWLIFIHPALQQTHNSQPIIKSTCTVFTAGKKSNPPVYNKGRFYKKERLFGDGVINIALFGLGGIQWEYGVELWIKVGISHKNCG